MLTQQEIDDIENRARSIFGKKAGDFWLDQPSPELGGRKPRDLMNPQEVNDLKDYLDSIWHGNYS